MDWISRWFMRQRAAKKRRTAPPKPPKSTAVCTDLAVKRELVDACVALDSDLPDVSRTRGPLAQEEEEEDSSSAHIPSSPTRYSMASSLPPSSSPPSSPPPAHTSKRIAPAPYREAATKPTSRMLLCVPYEDSRARLSDAPDAPPIAPSSAYMHHLSRRRDPSRSAVTPESASLAAGRSVAALDAIAAPKPTRPIACNPYLPRVPTAPAILPMSTLPPPSDWQQYLATQSSASQTSGLATSEMPGVVRSLNAVRLR